MEGYEVVDLTTHLGVEARVSTAEAGLALDASPGKAKEAIEEGLKELIDVVENGLSAAKPTKVTLSASAEVKVEPGAVAKLIIKGSGTGTLQLELEWALLDRQKFKDCGCKGAA